MSDNKKTRVAVSPEAFVRAWQSSKTVDEVAQKTGLDLRAARQRASIYRKKGVPLQRFAGGRFSKPDWAALTALAEELAPKG